MEKFKEQVNTLLHCFLFLLKDQEDASKLNHMLTSCMKEQGEDPTISALGKGCLPSQQEKFTSRDFKMTTDISGYDMDGVMLDLGSNVNILPKKS